MTPKPGWQNESERHSLAKHGIRTKTPKSISKLTDKYVGGNQWTFEIDEHGKIRLTNGNMTTAGWYWSGDKTDLVLFMSRLSQSSEKENFINEMTKEGITFEQLKPMLLYSLKHGDNQLYSITGDNQLWKFGQSSEPSVADMIDQYAIPELTESDKEKIIDKFWMKYTGVDEEEYMKRYGKEIETEMENAIKTSSNYNDFFKQLDRIDESSTYKYAEMEDEKVMETIGKVM